MKPLPMPIECWPIRYHRHGDTSQACPARITEVGRPHPDGSLPQISVNYTFPGGGEVLAMNNVRHVDDPHVKERPDLAHKFGTWSYLPGLLPVEEEETPKPKAKQSRSSEDAKRQEGLEKIREYASEGKALEEIHNKVKHLGFSKADVEEALTPQTAG